MLLQEHVRNEVDDSVKTEELIRLEKPSFDVLRLCLWTACRNGHAASANVLIQHGADVTHVNFYGRTMLMAINYGKMASEDKRLQLSQTMVQGGANPLVVDTDGKTALHYAVQFDRQPTAVWLSAFYEANTISDALFIAVQNNNVPMARKMIMCGADINYMSVNGVRPIVIATCRQACEMVAFLTFNGADINATVATGATPIHFAARLSIVVLTLVLQKGGDVKACTNQYNTALHYAVDAARLENVRLLLRSGSDPNAENERGETPLLLACRRHQNTDVIYALLVSGANPNKFDECMSYPLNQLVMQPTFNNFEAVDLLQAFGARVNPDHGVHPLALLCSVDSVVPFELIQGLILRGACLLASGWFDFITHQPTLLKLAVWALSCKRAAVAYFFTFVYGEEKGVRPVPAPRRLTGAYGLYPIRRRLAGYLVHRKASVRTMIQELVDQY